MSDQVHVIFKRHARKSRRGRIIRCTRTRRSLGPILFPNLDAARAAVADLAELGRPHVAVPCVRGRHWHLQPVVKEAPDVGSARAELAAEH